ncbi:hypothetical protein MF406_01710 [Georgenia sp. TF02-10]|uniref:hypothetical protein n=1 Tax=Georgenia sp. TF02-10 TaxID=2917725 RepID=UPI001FA7399F|nr:hypothetical protein [Georgenia sp. TF02-10]UNX55029.1 hypothetical protein MF406_01710 [Georgenia sp. TF02-10]
MSGVAKKILYQDVVPYDTPSSLTALHGPASGTRELPITVHWGPQHTYDLSNPDEQVFAYQQIVREGSTADQKSLLHADLLLQVWPELVLPPRCRAAWETKLPELTERR